jgi:hypothetical protein
MVVCVSVAAVANDGADTAYRRADVEALLKATPQIQVTSDPEIAPADISTVAIHGTDVRGIVDRDDVVDGVLGNGQRIVVVPLYSSYGRAAIYDELLWSSLRGRMRFVGYIPSTFGWLSAYLDRDKRLVVRTELFDHYHYDEGKDSFLQERYTLDGLRLRRLSREIVPASR